MSSITPVVRGMYLMAEAVALLLFVEKKGYCPWRPVKIVNQLLSKIDL